MTIIKLKKMELLSISYLFRTSLDQYYLQKLYLIKFDYAFYDNFMSSTYEESFESVAHSKVTRKLMENEGTCLAMSEIHGHKDYLIINIRTDLQINSIEILKTTFVISLVLRF